ncbi:Uncharacterized protein TCM_019082 [Theobroma cacao]|uniref:Uncharacterized protein n=1 Tax=Theobroma cacao TaxID=3641 RepID=A0A061EGT4_THECC|nr:Uncharacterized protein TCM_019082 [Theobroma cacao]
MKKEGSEVQLAGCVPHPARHLLHLASREKFASGKVVERAPSRAQESGIKEETLKHSEKKKKDLHIKKIFQISRGKREKPQTKKRRRKKEGRGLFLSAAGLGE